MESSVQDDQEKSRTAHSHGALHENDTSEERLKGLEVVFIIKTLEAMTKTGSRGRA